MMKRIMKLSTMQHFNKLNPFVSQENEDRKSGMYPYIPSGIEPQHLKTAMEFFRKHFGRKAKTFLDLGCGKGGAMYSALDAGLIPFGVEISKELLKTAKEIQKSGLIKNAEQLTFIQGDILKWVPDKQYDIVYFYHPLADNDLHDKFVKHTHKSFPIGQMFVIIGGVNSYVGYKYTEKYAGRGDIYLSIPIDDSINKINNMPVVAKIDNNFIFGRSGNYYKAATVHKNGAGRYQARGTKVKFELL